jgi:two-component system copper resistance phosphate regulon response regulator CusR
MPKEPAAKVPSGKKILIVEDERPLAHALELKLASSGYQTTLASSGADALRETTTGKFDLILLDLILPGIDGFGVLKTLHEKKNKTPIIVLSNLGQDEDQQRAKEYGAVGYCVKSNTPLSAIVEQVHSILS